MIAYTCTKCGHRVMSKNIATRSSFPVGEDRFSSATFLPSISCISIVDDPQRPAGQEMISYSGPRREWSRPESGKDLEIRVTIHQGPTEAESDTPAAALTNYLTIIRGMTDVEMAQYICSQVGRHDYVSPDKPLV